MSRTPSANTPPRPARLGRYEVIRLLGAGGMADVYPAREVAVGFWLEM